MARSTRGSKKSATPPPSAQVHQRSESPADAAEEVAAEISEAPEPVVLPPTTPIRQVVNIFGGHLTEELRQAIIQKHEEEPDLSQVQLTDWLEKTYGVKVNRTTVGRTIQKAGKPRPVHPRHRVKTDEGTGTPPKGPKKLDLDQAVYDWYLEKARSLDTASAQTGSSAPVLAFGVHTFRDKANELAQTGFYDMPANAQFSDRWLKSFLKRFNLTVTELPVYDDGQPVSDESSTAAANIEGGSGNGSEEGVKWPAELRPYLAPTDGDEEEEASESEGGQRKKQIVVAATEVASPTLLQIRWNSAQHVTEEMRQALLQKRREEPSISQHQLAGWLNATYGVRVHRATVGRNLKRSLLESGLIDPTDKRTPKKVKEVSILRAEDELYQNEDNKDDEIVIENCTVEEAFEAELKEWYLLSKNAGLVPTDKQLLEKARSLKKEGGFDLPASFTLSASWRNSFKRRNDLAEAKDTEGEEIVGRPTMPDVHRSVGIIRTYVFNEHFDQDTKKELLQGLDDIYIKIGEANRKSK